jgi:hypothetical protein
MLQRTSQTSKYFITVLRSSETHKKTIIRSTTSTKVWKIIFTLFRRVFLSLLLLTVISLKSNIQPSYCSFRVDRHSSVGIATGYGLEGTGIESRWGEIFRTDPDRPWGPPSLPCNVCRIFFGKTAGAWHWPPKTSIAEVKERVELSLSPVVGWNLICLFRALSTIILQFYNSQQKNARFFLYTGVFPYPRPTAVTWNPG